ncbi:MAG: hypothetical protein A3J09_02695 [Candidatus Zambryskibacteria bacterium RIFCSPLOWO2_02_FULL_51_21]|uniref:DUF541 domain-containing protein n=1 Tax=Candidatus Zambryskibacteria bacterium RIFCSPHIGHO2_02_FULL_43_37 TaxID=1802749 RepID=A0A1G2TI70_9BACT|nr:MAG: hypothetical protein A2723_02685 [Candidatus Zambryskibacteria bacterium RIFCSPHIGHO2_01_FULL_52_18]OHA96311.1 MAG: hypothetical protein A3D49_00205 [Candidatus Zambryskibacteria bacterium RIFCSPHIGHO2_02_FULL_43_37]OHB07714.1 MAG: hypothetical protein A2944_00080 [Candidatus Zambryskibacteria bacterium RIFCSPLOWO2_01_FULL_52_12]OHB11430.1 MAG: hypothetical protein A3J09_02695 [Candidatus Zambryskibacteria bacterium RIFCSPLOWO2_02_FULL_51_21]
MNTQEMKNIYKWAWIVLIILAVFLGVKTLASLKDLRDTSPSYNTISVSGEGEVMAVPDLASFTFTVSADANTVDAAQEAVTKKVDAILAELKDLGIEEKDIKTTDYSVWPKYRYETRALYPCTQYSCPPSPGNQVPDGYTANHSVMVKVRDTENAGEALSRAGSAGATNLSGISFTIDDPEKLKSDARALAIKNAREKAEILSDELGVRLVRVVSYSDSSDGGVVPYYREVLGMGGSDIKVVPPTPTLPTGENKIKINVNVTYEIR